MTTPSKSESAAIVGKTWSVWLANLVATMGIGLCGVIWTSVQAHDERLSDHNQRITAIESNRYTSNDGHAAEMRLAAELQALWREVYGIKETVARMPTEIPPKWFLEKVGHLEVEIREVRKLIENK